MTKIDIVSGFLGAGKTTLIKKMLSAAYQGEKLRRRFPEGFRRADQRDVLRLHLLLSGG